MEVKIENWDSTKNCRVCLNVYSVMFPLFGLNAASYCEMLIKCSKVDIKENDGLPMVICEYCAQKIIQVCDFLTKCQETDKHLRLLLAKRNDNYFNDAEDDLKNPDEIKDEPNISSDECPVDDLICKVEVDECYAEDEHLKKKVRKNKFKKKKDKTLSKCRSKKNKLSLNCEQCGLLVRSKSAMIIHVATHSDERPFHCRDCGKTYRSRGNLRKHIIMTHSGDESRRHRCEECNKAFHCRSELVVHSRTHTGDTPYQCEWCPKAFTQISGLSRHRLTHTGEKAFQCAECGKKFLTRDHLRHHMLTHSSEKKFVCKICGCLLKSRSSLSKHQLLHTNIKSFVCDQCGRSFRTKGNLKLHMDNKHSEKSGYCTICTKRFSNIEEHNNIHTGKTPFQCSMCNNKYGVKRSLVVHMRKHENQEKYSCEYQDCLKKFPIKCMLEFHVLKYHKKQTPHVCEHCNRGFFRLNDLNLHKKMNHFCMYVPKKTPESKIS